MNPEHFRSEPNTTRRYCRALAAFRSLPQMAAHTAFTRSDSRPDVSFRKGGARGRRWIPRTAADFEQGPKLLIGRLDCLNALSNLKFSDKELNQIHQHAADAGLIMWESSSRESRASGPDDARRNSTLCMKSALQLLGQRPRSLTLLNGSTSCCLGCGPGCSQERTIRQIVFSQR